VDNLRSRIATLKEQLGSLGYHGFQVDSMIKETIGKTSVDDATRDQQEELIEVLESYLSFAQKCKQRL
jgi:hypothetical protein